MLSVGFVRPRWCVRIVRGQCPDAGASSRLVFRACPPGTFNPERGAFSNASCIACDPGTFNPVSGSSDASVCRDCLPGSYTDETMAIKDSCARCSSGTFQDVEGQTVCKPCLAGAYCPVGAAAPKPCPGGTWSNASGLASQTGCVAVPPGFWSTIGSAVPLKCPPSGFTCPGSLADRINSPPGSLPIQLPTGTISHSVTALAEVPQLIIALELNLDVSSLSDHTALAARLATTYGVSAEDITLSVDGGSVLLTAAILARSATAEDLRQRFDSLGRTPLEDALGAPLMREPLISNGSAIVNTTVVSVLACGRGMWCSAGYSFPCLAGWVATRRGCVATSWGTLGAAHTHLDARSSRAVQPLQPTRERQQWERLHRVSATLDVCARTRHGLDER